MTHGVAVPIGAVVAAVAIVMWHGYSSGVILAVMARRKKTIAMVPKAALQLAAIFLVVRGDIVGSSAGLDFIVQLRDGNRRKHKQQEQCLHNKYVLSLHRLTYIYDCTCYSICFQP